MIHPATWTAEQSKATLASLRSIATLNGSAPISPEEKELIEGVDFEDEDYGLEILKRELQRDQKVMLWWD